MLQYDAIFLESVYKKENIERCTHLKRPFIYIASAQKISKKNLHLCMSKTKLVLDLLKALSTHKAFHIIENSRHNNND